MEFIKVHGLGNDFVLVDARKEKELPADPEKLAMLARQVCDRNFGVGADGLVLVRESTAADVYMQIINNDGSEAEMCGNAVRCVARYVFEKDGVRGDRIKVETLAGIKVPEIVHEENEMMIRVDMGEPVLERSMIPMLGEPGRVIKEPLETQDGVFTITAVSMGNPHCVIFADDLKSVPLDRWGPRLEVHPSFPRKTNVEFVQVMDTGEVAMRVWERGAGITLACGTGACAVTVASVLNGYTDRKVKVNLQGGALTIEWNPLDDRVYMTGPAEFVFTGSCPV